MKFYSIDNNKLKRDSIDNSLDVFTKTISDNVLKNVTRYKYIVQPGEECRIDKICISIYGSDDYIEELMYMNNTVNPFTIKAGDTVLFVDSKYITQMYITDNKAASDDKKQQLVNTSKNNKLDPNHDLPPTVKPSNSNQINIDYTQKIITINNTLK